MKVVHSLEAIAPSIVEGGTVLTIGNFDGVHRAHRVLLDAAGRLAAPMGVPVVVLTLEPHPLTILAPEKAPSRLTPLSEKLLLLESAGVDITVVARSEPALLAMEPEAFIEDVVIRRLRPLHILEGPTFGFGRGRRGTPALLATIAERHGCRVHIVEPMFVTLEGSGRLPLSSSLIRRLLAVGDVAQANEYLGRPYAIVGVVGRGDGRGCDLGFPTANVEATEQLIPGDGVYAGAALVGDQWRLAAVSIGQTPTFGGATRRLEVHLLVFSGDLYGESIRAELDVFMRPQRTFSSADDLARQIRADVERVRSLVNLRAPRASSPP